MNPIQELKTIENTLIFLRRTNLSGEEVIAFNEVMTYILTRQQGLSAVIEKQKEDEGKEPPTPAKD
jgi:hypothetical protein